jgi:hypothetical protein
MTNLEERISTATQFIKDVDLPRASSSHRAGGGLSAKLKPVNSKQSLAVGHGVITFMPQMPSRQREAVVYDIKTGNIVEKIQTAETDPIIHGVTVHDGYLWYCEVEQGRICNIKL